MEGFIDIKIPAWLRRLVSRGITIFPALIGIIFFGESCLAQLMIFSQIVLSLQLPFAVFPLIRFTSDRVIMGSHANSWLLKIIVFCIALAIVFSNLLLLYFLIRG